MIALPSRWRLQVLLVGLLSIVQCAAPATTLDALWQGKAHFEQVGELDWGRPAGAVPPEQAGWFTVQKGVWYAFNRVTLPNPVSYCHQDHTRVVVRESRDRGKSWTSPVTAVEPGDSANGDACAVLDGSSYYDEPTATWHMLVQCLDRESAGGWALCHYSRKNASPVGRFMPDPRNPVVRGGALWSRICGERDAACPATTQDEGTPEIIGKRDGRFIVTMHGFDYRSKQSFRGAVSTPDFRQWEVGQDGMPAAPLLGPLDCGKWIARCAGVGEASTVIDGDYVYMVIEAMDRSLLCSTDQNWIFSIVRAPREKWPRTGSTQWQNLLGHAVFITRTSPDRDTLCALQYARWISDGTDRYLVYEDWGPKRAYIHRRLLKLVPGAGRLIQKN